MKHYHKNPRQITEKQFNQLQTWLEEYGDLSGIVHNITTDEIIGGNQRSEAMHLMNGTKPTITHKYKKPTKQGTIAIGYYDFKGERMSYRQVKWGAKKAEGANIIANKAGGTWDFDVLANGFDIPDLLEWGWSEKELQLGGFEFGDDSKDAEPQIDRAAELLKKWKVVTGDMFAIGEHRLICGDCTDAATVARVMGGEKADLLITDPPYNVDKDYGDEVDDSKLAADYKVFLDTWFLLWHGVSEKQIVTIGRRRFEEGFWNGLPIKATGCWTKTNAVSRGRITQSSCWEPIIFVGERWNRNRPNDVFDFPVGMQSGVGDHPCPKPLKFWKHLIEQYSEEGAVIADCFDGAGTTLLACEQTNRKARTAEISPAYVAVALERMSQAFPGIRIERVK